MDRFFTMPPSYEHTCRYCEQLKADNPEIKLFSIGKSCLGRKIYALALGNLKEATLLAGAFHAQEWLTCSLLLRFFGEVAHAYTQKSKLLDVDIRRSMEKKGLICVPTVNPDGVEIALNGSESAKQLQHYVESIMASSSQKWQANARGIDLNHNYDAGFKLLRAMEKSQGINAPAPGQYGGKRANSEPETRAMVNLCKAFDVKKVLAFHAQGEEIYYEYGVHTPSSSRPIAALLADACGYRLVQNEGLASHGGFKDWFIDKMRRPGFTVEIGSGENPLPIEDLEPIYARLLEMMLLAVLI